MGVKTRLRNTLSCPLWAGRQERAIQHLKAFKIMRLWHRWLQLHTERQQKREQLLKKIQVFEVWCMMVRDELNCITLHMTWDILEAVLITVTFSRLTRKADSSLCRSLSLMLPVSVTYISQPSLISTGWVEYKWHAGKWLKCACCFRKKVIDCCVLNDDLYSYPLQEVVHWPQTPRAYSLQCRCTCPCPEPSRSGFADCGLGWLNIWQMWL